MSSLGIGLDQSASAGSSKTVESKMISTVCVVSSAKEPIAEVTHALIKEEPTTENYGDATSSQPDSSYIHKITPLQLILTWTNVKPEDTVIVTQELLDCIPTNTCSEATHKWIKENMICGSLTGHISDRNDGNKLDTTILYWKEDEYKKLYKKCTKTKSRKHKKQKRKNVSTPPQVSFNFEVSVHRIHRRRCKYILICKVQSCEKKF